MKLTMLGTGAATVTKCYNTCFVMEEKEECFLVDGGGGNGILLQLQKAEIELGSIKHIFVTHKHTDHLFGVVWVIRMICQGFRSGACTEDVYVYSHKEVIELLKSLVTTLLWEKITKYIGEKVHFVVVEDGQEISVLGKKVHVFDIHSEKTMQMGFTMCLQNNDKFTCCGDEPYHPSTEKYVRNSKWLMHEAFCLYSERDIFKPYEKHHSTVKEACELAEKMQIENLILYHTEDKNLENRKELYLEEGTAFYRGNLLIPNDLEVILI